jgi:DNA-binding transcriptional MerR regulator
MEKQIEIGLREIRASIKRIKELLKWQKRQRQEGKGRRTPPSFRFQDRLEADIKIEDGVFWKTAFEIQDVLGERNDEAAKKARERMARLESEMREMTRRG